MSVHYICCTPDEHIGPRYNRIKALKFEVQVRTLCMNAWAVVSHYLDYKGDWDVPSDLKRALTALSGLFYVADNEFEQVYNARISSKDRAQTIGSKNGLLDKEIDLDTLTAYLQFKFPDRIFTVERSLSELVHELKVAGYNILSEVDSEIAKASESFNRYEKAHPPGDHQNRNGNEYLFTAEGLARLSMAIASEAFFRVAYTNKDDDGRDDPLLNYKLW